MKTQTAPCGWPRVEDGLVRYDRETQTFVHFMPETGAAKYISCIQEDARGTLWMGTALGLARFDPASETFSYFDARDGLMIGEGIACFQNEQGEMFFGSWAGLVSFFPDQIRDNPHPPAVVITALNLKQPGRCAPTCPLMSKSSCPTGRTTFPSISPPWITQLRPRTSMPTRWKDWRRTGSRPAHAAMPTTRISSPEPTPSG